MVDGHLFLDDLSDGVFVRWLWVRLFNDAANVLATYLSNQMMSDDAVFVYKNSHYFIKRTN